MKERKRITKGFETAGAAIQRISAAGRFFMISLGNKKAYD